jgi:hypothetical protein
VNYGDAGTAQPATYSNPAKGEEPVAYSKPAEGEKPVTYATPADGERSVAYTKPEEQPQPGVYTYGDKPPHKIDEEEKSFKRNFYAGIIGIFAGICFLISGVNGAGFFRDLSTWVAPVAGDLKDTIVTAFMVMAAVATLGGILVVGGGAAIVVQRLFTGKLLCFIGGGTGLTGLIIAIVMPLWQGSLSQFGNVLLSLCSLSGLGTILAIISGFMTRLPVPLRYMLKGKR